MEAQSLDALRSLFSELRLNDSARAPAKPLGLKETQDLLWAHAGQERENGRRRQLMKFLCWLWYKRGVQDPAVIGRVAADLSAAKAPYAYFRPGSPALERLTATVAVQRHEDEKAARQAEDQKLGIGRKP